MLGLRLAERQRADQQRERSDTTCSTGSRQRSADPAGSCSSATSPATSSSITTRSISMERRPCTPTAAPRPRRGRSRASGSSTTPCAHNQYGINGAGSSSGNAALAAYFPGAVVQGNWLQGGTASRYPAGNLFSGTFAAAFMDVDAAETTGCRSSSVLLGARTDRHQYRRRHASPSATGAAPRGRRPGAGSPRNLPVGRLVVRVSAMISEPGRRAAQRCRVPSACAMADDVGAESLPSEAAAADTAARRQPIVPARDVHEHAA